MRTASFFFLIAAGMVFMASCGEPEPAVTADTGVTAENSAGNLPMEQIDASAEAPELTIGYVNQDHHSAVFVAALRPEMMHENYPVYLIPLGESYYALIKDNQKVAEIQFIQSQGAINVPNNMQAGLFEMGFGGVNAFAAAVDQGNPIRIVAPLHQDGDMLVVSADNETVNDWGSFLAWLEASEGPITVGFKSPKAVALIIFQSALTEAGVNYAMSGAETPETDVILYNSQGEPNLNPALQEGLIDAYVSNNPACAMAEHNGIGRCVAELSLLPPGDFENHPCCAIAATEASIAEKPEAVAAALELFMYSTDFINANPEEAAAAASEWIGTPLEVEIVSMATSTYDMRVTESWNMNMGVIMDHMRALNSFTGPLAEVQGTDILPLITDFSLLPEELK